MPKAALLFNGIDFSFPLVDQAFEWAKQNNGSLVALFLRAKHETKEGYFFPSDLDAAQDLQKNADAEAANTRVLESNMSMLKHRANGEGIDLTSHLLNDPSDEQIVQQLSDCQRMFIDEKFNEPGILRVKDIHLDKLLDKAGLPIVKVQV
jgi:hypothetical protein